MMANVGDMVPLAFRAHAVGACRMANGDRAALTSLRRPLGVASPRP